MSHCHRALLILIVTSIVALNVHSQATKLTEVDVNAIVSSATSAGSLLPRREKALTELFNDRALPANHTIVYTKAFLPPNNSQVFYSSENGAGKSVHEIITIGPNIYVREENGAWKLETPEERAALPPPPKSIPMPLGADETVTVAHRPNVQLDGNITDFYELEKTSTKSDKNGLYKTTSVTRYWINKNGTLAKLETETSPSNSKPLYRRTVIYEYDPNIKIEAPIK